MAIENKKDSKQKVSEPVLPKPKELDFAKITAAAIRTAKWATIPSIAMEAIEAPRLKGGD